MSPRDVARLIAAGRIAIGAALMVAPRLTTRLWLGDDADRAGTQVVARAMGVRDVVTGAIALHTLDHHDVGPRWQRTLAGVDAVDLGATLAARRELPRVGVAMVVAMASAGIGGQLWAAERLSHAGPG
ncbi:MAG: hypothetical protein ACRDLS_00735 [Solirubrobacteraceae bacterium]